MTRVATCYLPTDAISDQTLIVYAHVLSQRLSSWLMDVRTVGHSAGFSMWSVQISFRQ